MSHRKQVGRHPKVGMHILYQRDDGMWLLQVTGVSTEFVSYRYKIYKQEASATHRPREVDLDLLKEVTYYRKWKHGSENNHDGWFGFITGEAFKYMGTHVMRVLTDDAVPSWEL